MASPDVPFKLAPPSQVDSKMTIGAGHPAPVQSPPSSAKAVNVSVSATGHTNSGSKK